MTYPPSVLLARSLRPGIFLLYFYDMTPPSASFSATSFDTVTDETLAVHGLGGSNVPYLDIVPPLHPSSTFERAGDGSYPGGRVYARDQSPSYDRPEALLAQLEGGSDSLLFASGMAAATAVLTTLEPGTRVLAPRSMYWALRRWLVWQAEQGRIELTTYANADLDDLARQLRPGAKQLLWIETPANPDWALTDIAAAAELAHAAGARVVADSTVATPVLTRPLALGADLVLHSATKYLNGHSDLVAGALVTREADEPWRRIALARNLGGATLGAFEAWLLLRGMRTLFLRVRAASANALEIAQRLEGHPAVAQVLYPGLPSHPGHGVATRQMTSGFGGMLSLRLAGGEAAARGVVAHLRLFRRATSLGSVESLAEHRASVEGPDSLCPPDLVRLSVGIEPIADLLDDLLQALGSGVTT